MLLKKRRGPTGVETWVASCDQCGAVSEDRDAFEVDKKFQHKKGCSQRHTESIGVGAGSHDRPAMTRDQVLAMEPGAEMDNALAHLLGAGATSRVMRRETLASSGESPGGASELRLPPFSTRDSVAAGMLVQIAVDRGWNGSVEFDFQKSPPEITARVGGETVSAPALALAICRAVMLVLLADTN